MWLGLNNKNVSTIFVCAPETSHIGKKKKKTALYSLDLGGWFISFPVFINMFKLLKTHPAKTNVSGIHLHLSTICDNKKQIPDLQL